jgi:hypothetical protein
MLKDNTHYGYLEFVCAEACCAAKKSLAINRDLLLLIHRKCAILLLMTGLLRREVRALLSQSKAFGALFCLVFKQSVVGCRQFLH